MGCVIAELFMEGKALFDLSKVCMLRGVSMCSMWWSLLSILQLTCCLPCSCCPTGEESTILPMMSPR